MAINLSKSGITNGQTIEPWHVTQSIDAFNGTVAYDIKLSGSFNLTGSFTQGNTNNISTGTNSHAQGGATQATNINAHSEGASTIASGNSSHAEGSTTLASGSFSHAEGYGTIALGAGSHAEGYPVISGGDIIISNIAIGIGSHVEGTATTASAAYSHAEGSGSITYGSASHAGGINTIASGSGQTVVGRYNTHGDSTSRFIVGNGTDESNRKDAFKITRSGSMALPQTQSAAPTWNGVDGEIIPATVTGTHYIYVWMSGAWRSSSLA